jgi:hypothetical protein
MAGHLRLLAAMPGTAPELAKRTKMTVGGASKLARTLWTVGLCHPAEMVKGKNNQFAPRWALGEGKAAGNVCPGHPGSLHAMTAAAIRELMAGATTHDLAESSGCVLQVAQRFATEAKRLRLVRVVSWVRTSPHHWVAVYQWGQGENARKPAPITPGERWATQKTRRKANRAWRGMTAMMFAKTPATRGTVQRCSTL